MPVILNIETSTNVCSIALSENGNCIFSKVNADGLNHAKLLSSFIEEALTFLKEQNKKLDAVAVSAGPGSYTGLRIGVSTAKGLCYGLGIPLISISTLAIMALAVVSRQSSVDSRQSIVVSRQLSVVSRQLMTNDYRLTTNDYRLTTDDYLLCPMIDARRMEVYAAFFNEKNELIKDISADIIDENSYHDLLTKQPVYFFGNGAEKCKEVLTHQNARFLDEIVPLAENMILFSEQYFAENKFEDVAYFEPFYLKEFQTTKPLNPLKGTF